MNDARLTPKRVGILAVDLVQFALTYYLAFVLRLERLDLGRYAGVFWTTLPVAVAWDFAGMYLAGTYRGIWRYAGINDLFNIVKGTALAALGLIVTVVFMAGTHGYPRSVFLIHAALVLLAIGLSRFAWRFYREVLRPERDEGPARPVLVVGAGSAADALLRELRGNPRLRLKPVGIVDDDRGKAGRELHGVKVIGAVGDLPRLVRAKGAEEILIAIPSATGERMRAIVEACRRAEVPFRTVPGTGDILDGRVLVSQLRNVRLQDLLRREPVRLDRAAVSACLKGRRVLVSGAGGSIGSELVRQIARFDPAELVLLDHAENGLFYLEEEMSRRFPRMRAAYVVADVTDSPRIREVFERAPPEVVFHAAAHKHVGLMERNPREAFRNNVGGTRNLAEAAVRAGSARFVMVSTDKAVRPTSVMGLSKRVAEILVQEIGARPGTGTEFVAVRFGNVMGSEGSVIPLFNRQLRAGGPLTVTHPEVTRYFMLIPEAVQLVLQAGAMGRGGEIYVLDMGEPLKVADLARQLVRLSGLEPDRDVEIRYIGLRSGEKLFEELVTAGEGIVPTAHEKLLVLRAGAGEPRPDVLERIARIEGLVERCAGREEIMELAREIVPEYRDAAAGAATNGGEGRG